MRFFTLVFVLAAGLLALSGCDGCGAAPVSADGGRCSSDEDCAQGLVCSAGGSCVPTVSGDDGGTGLLDGGDAGDAGESDGGGTVEPIREPNPNAVDNDTLDSDCDGISDADEFGDLWPGGQKTDPAVHDTDGDGIPDGVEAARTEAIDGECATTPRDADPTTSTNPTNPDSDGDCIPDGLEDRNRNGRVDDGETDPRSRDSDRDGLADGAEDANCNGVVDPGESDPRNPDTDGDGIPDGAEVELGLDPVAADSDGDGIPDGEELANGTDPVTGELDSDGDGLADAVELTIGTDPMVADSDGDGLCDGRRSVADTCTGGEDKNGNGLIDPGESDPLSTDTDCDGLVAIAEAIAEIGRAHV